MTMTQYFCVSAIILIAPHIEKSVALVMNVILLALAIFWAIK